MSSSYGAGIAQHCTVQCRQPRNGLLLTLVMMRHEEWMHICRLDRPMLQKLLTCVFVMQHWKWMRAFKLDLVPLFRLRYLRLVNIAPLDVIVRSGCKVSMDLHAEDSLESPLCTHKICAIFTAKWTLPYTV